MSKRDLTVIAGQNIETEQNDGVDQHHVELEHAVVTHQKWQSHRARSTSTTNTDQLPGTCFHRLRLKIAHASTQSAKAQRNQHGHAISRSRLAE